MLKHLICSLIFFVFAPCTFAQMTPFQKLVDFEQLVALFDKRYAHYEWKRDALHYDGLNLVPWLARLNASQSDMDFFEICAEYVAKYQDGHSGFVLPSDYEATLGFTVDIYSGKVLVDSIDRQLLKEADYPFQNGDELVSIDNKTAADWISYLSKFNGDGNSSSARRLAAELLTQRMQAYFPRAHEIDNNAAVVILRQTGETQSFTIPWNKSGTPYVQAGPVPDPVLSAPSPGAVDDDTPSWMRTVRELQYSKAHPERASLLASSLASLGVDLRRPVFDLPATFVPHAGLRRSDYVYSGIFQAGGYNIGYLRIPDFEYVSNAVQTEITYLQDKTDGLIVDVMRNPGGFVCEAEAIARSLTVETIHSLGLQVRATWSDVLNLNLDLADAKLFGTQSDVDAIQKLLTAFRDAYSQSRGMTAPIAMCGPSKDLDPAVDSKGNLIRYGKPVMLLTDELSASAAEILAAILQDNKRALLYGMRTDGAGGSVSSYSVGAYMEGGAHLARSILIRKDQTVTTDYPAAPYIENIGVRPEIQDDYMRIENLLNKGKPFVDGFTAAMVDYIKSKKSN